MPSSDVPVIRQSFQPGDRLPFWVGSNVVDAHFLFDLGEDPAETENRAGTGAVEEAEMLELLRVALKTVGVFSASGRPSRAKSRALPLAPLVRGS